MKTATKKKDRTTSADAEKQLQSFINKFDPQHQALICALRTALRKRLPTANDLVWDNYNFFVIGYSATEGPSDSVISIAAAANGADLAFYRGATLPDPHKILQGSGSQNRFFRTESEAILARPEVETLIAAAIGQNTVPFAPSGREEADHPIHLEETEAKKADSN